MEIKKSLEEMTIEELEEYVRLKKGDKPREVKKKMKTGKKALWTSLLISIALIVFSMAMIVMDKDTQTTSILGGAGVASIPFLFGIYEKFSTEISLKNMEKNFIEDYDEKQGIY